MCNELHSDHEKISEEGQGFKIFERNNTALFYFNNSHRQSYESSEDGWIAWNGRYESSKDMGFCIFLSREVAEECFRIIQQEGTSMNNEYQNCYILPIEYKEGLGKHIETRITPGDYEIAIVKQFRIIKE